MNELAIFAGAGGGILGGKLLGWTTICAVERDAYAAQILVQRQNDGILKPFPIWSDVCSFDGRPWKGVVDVVSGGFPCQDISPARTNSRVNGKHLGLNGGKSGLWFQQLRIIREVEPEWALVENSSHLAKRGLDVILSGLAEAGYDAEWDVFSSAEEGADHVRERLFILAHSDGAQRKRGSISCGIYQEDAHLGCADRRENQPRLERVAYGVAYQMDRLRAIGNGQDARVAATAFTILSNRFV